MKHWRRRGIWNTNVQPLHHSLIELQPMSLFKEMKENDLEGSMTKMFAWLALILVIYDSIP